MSITLHFTSDTCQHQSCPGPLAEYFDGFAAWMSQQGYSHSSAATKLGLIRALSHWLGERDIEVSMLDEARLQKFLATAGTPRGVGSETTGRQFLQWLRSCDVIAPAITDVGDDPVARLQFRFAVYLRDECGASAATVERYLWAVGVFLRYVASLRSGDLQSLTLSDVNSYIGNECARYQPATVKAQITAIRRFLRYLYRCGDIVSDISPGIFTVRNYRQAGLPKALEQCHVEALITSCDTTTAAGRRDCAVLLLLARLGLRACEVIRMTLDDIDWHGSTLTVRGKGGRLDRLPLPCEVAQATAAYLLDGHPGSTDRRLFLRLRAPHRGFQDSSSVFGIFRRACKRAGLDDAIHSGPHSLRHSLATGMLRNGASLEHIRQVLRHESADTTRIYAKVDLDRLRPLARQWPGDAS